MVKQIPIAEGLFKIPELPSEKPYLIGSKCKDCGHVFFPKRGCCATCYGNSLEDVTLPDKGKVYTCIIYKYEKRLPLGYTGGKVPYAFGYVMLPGEIAVETDFSDFDMSKPLKYGTAVQLKLRKFRVDDIGNEIVTHTFQPIK